MKAKEEMTHDELLVRRIIIAYRDQFVGERENAFLDMGEDEDRFIEEFGLLTKEDVERYIYTELMIGNEKYIRVPNTPYSVEKKHIKFMGKQFIDELIEDRVVADYEKNGWMFPNNF